MAGMISSIFSPRMLVALAMGFSSGLPFLLTLSLLQAWLQQAGVDLTVIGIAALVGLPYTFKFLWAPLMDCWVPPFLGRRWGWLAISQVLLMAAIATLGLCDPNDHPLFLGATAFLVAFFSASQDIVIDAYRREDLKDKELGLGSSLAVNGYRVGMLLASGGGLILADHIPFSQVYLVMAACQGLGLATTLLAHEPQTNEHPPKSLKEAMGIPRVLLSAPTGFMAKHLGWEWFFLFCTFIALPGLLLLVKYAPWGGGEPPQTK